MGFYTKNAGLVGPGTISVKQGVYDQEFNRLTGGAGAGASTLSGIFTGSSSTFIYSWADRWTANNTVPGSSGWPQVTGGNGHFVSGFALTSTPTSSGIGNVLSSGINTYINSDRTLLSVTAPQGASTSYIVSAALNFSSASDGAWLEQVQSRTLEFTFSSSATNFGNATGFIVQSFSNGGFHKCLVCSLTHSGITRFFAPKFSITLVSTAAPVSYLFYPLNASFTSFSDSRLTSATGPTLTASYFEY